MLQVYHAGLGWTRAHRKRYRRKVNTQKSIHTKNTELCKKGPQSDALIIYKILLALFWSTNIRRDSPRCRGWANSNRTPPSASLRFCCDWGFVVFVVWILYKFCRRCSSVTHLLRDLVGVQDARYRHLDLVFLLLGLTERRFPLLQEQV